MVAKTYADLSSAPDVQDGDLLASFRGTGPLKNLTAAALKNYIGASFVPNVSLASTSGAGLMGTLQTGTGAVSRTQASKNQDVLTAKDFGVVANGTTDDTAAMQAAINQAVASGRPLDLTGLTGDVRCYSGLTITGPVHIRGAGKGLARFIFVNGSSAAVGGFTINAGVSDVWLDGINIATSPRYTTTPNTVVGLTINGTNVSNCRNIIISNCFFDGWQDAIVANYAREPVFDGVTTVYCFRGIWLKGQSTNFTITGSCRITGIDSTAGTPAAGSTGIRVGDATSPQPEGGCVQPGALVFGFARGLRLQGAINVDSIGVRYDAISEFGVLDQSDNTALSSNHNIIGNFFGMIGGAGSIGIYSTNSTTDVAKIAQSRGVMWDANEICVYTGKSVDSGIIIEGVGQRNVTVRGTKEIKGTVTLVACGFTGGTGGKVIGNAWDTGGFSTTVAVGYGLNSGTISAGASLCVDALSIADAVTEYRVGGVKVVGARNTGWTAATGTGSKGAYAAAAAGTANAAYVQADFQTALNRIAAAEARLKAHDDMLFTHGLIGA